MVRSISLPVSGHALPAMVFIVLAFSYRARGMIAEGIFFREVARMDIPGFSLAAHSIHHNAGEICHEPHS